MNYWPGQLILAARNGDGNLLEIIVFVIMIIFYAIIGTIKARANKSMKEKQGKQMPRNKPVHKPPARPVMRGAKQKPWHAEKPKPKPGPVIQTHRPVIRKPVRIPSRKIVRPQAAARMKQPTEAEGVVKLPSFEAEPKMGEVSGLTAEAAVPAAEMPQTEYFSEILSDYEDPERLRRAILHYEILGKPVSLREPSEHIGRF